MTQPSLTRTGRSASSPADPAPSIYDFDGAAASALEGAGIPDFVADALAELSARGYTPQALHDFGRWAYRHIDPLIAQAERDAA